MSDIAIRVHNLGKKYRIGVMRHDTLRDQIMHGVKSIFQIKRNGAEHSGELWALRDVSFEIKRGEVVGVIGSNGAGKSTLLKILSQITEPTEGRVELFGRVGSLLEVGTGFHPELTGRENIYLNGAILGMTRNEIRRKFDEIVDFSEIEKFLDTPVKRYSSGMYVRLAFAVAAHLEPEILVVDEVLAVGDAAFQKKCLGKMGEVAHQGRTVLFVIHNMAAVQALCTRGIYLQHGTIWKDGEINDTISTYLKTLEEGGAKDISERKDRAGRGRIRLTRVEVNPLAEKATRTAVGAPARFVFHISDYLPGTSCDFTIYDSHGHPVANFNSLRESPSDMRVSDTKESFICEVDELMLTPGRYRLNVALRNFHVTEDHVEAAAFFDVEPGYLRGRPSIEDGRYGSLAVPHRWIMPEDEQ